jgi:hypothetical protein
MGNLAVGRKRRKFFVLNLSNCGNDGEEVSSVLRPTLLKGYSLCEISFTIIEPNQGQVAHPPRRDMFGA